MTSKDQLQSKIRELEEELKTFKEQLNNYKEITIETAVPGDVLEDGSIVFKKENGLALLVAPESTEVVCQWSEQFPEVFDKLKEQGFNPSQWFVPTQEQLTLAYSSIRHHFSGDRYWSSTEVSSTFACSQNFILGNLGTGTKADSFRARAFCGTGTKSDSFRARAFRCVTYLT